MQRAAHHSDVPWFIAEFLDYCLIEEGYSKATIATYRQVLAALASWLAPRLGASFEPTQITKELIRAWQYHLRAERQLDDATYVKYVSALRSMLGYLREEGLTQLTPEDAKLPKAYVDLSHVQALTPEEVAAMIQAADSATPWGRRDRCIVAVLYSSGLRVAELCALDRRQIREDTLGHQEVIELSIVGKGRRPRLVFVDRLAQQLLQAYLTTRNDTFPALFRPYRGKVPTDGRLTRRMVDEIIGKLAKEAGIASSPTPHVLRHSFAISKLQGGADSRVVQALLGHASLSTTQRYTKITDRHLRESYLAAHRPAPLPDE